MLYTLVTARRRTSLSYIAWTMSFFEVYPQQILVYVDQAWE